MKSKRKIDARWILAVASGKGGVGKSTCTVALAQAFHRRGKRVGILDADLYGPSMRIMMGESKTKVCIKNDRLIPADCGGIQVMGLSYFQMQNTNITRAPVANSFIEKMLFNTDWNDLDILLIDFPPGTGDIAITIMQQVSISGAVLVSGPQIVSLSDVNKFFSMTQASSIPVLGIIENMAFFEDSVSRQIFYPFGEGKVHGYCKEHKINFLGQIGMDPKLSDALDFGKNIFDKVQGQTSKAFEAIADKVFSRLETLNRVFFTIEKMHKRVCLLQALKRKITLHASDIQKRCPCASCLQKIEVQDPEIEDLKKVGEYGVAFKFSSGCNCGIYPIELLLEIGGVE